MRNGCLALREIRCLFLKDLLLGTQGCVVEDDGLQPERASGQYGHMAHDQANASLTELKQSMGLALRLYFVQPLAIQLC